MTRGSHHVPIEGDDVEGHIARVHTHIGDVPGVIVELRPEEFDIPSERDMTHLRDEDARVLYEELKDYFEGESDG